jgi:hypothetical protein
MVIEHRHLQAGDEISFSAGAGFRKYLQELITNRFKVDLSVIDAKGRADRVTIRLK